MTFEDRLRTALHAEADAVEVDTRAWAKVEEQLERRRGSRVRSRVAVGLLAAAVVAGVLGAAVLLIGDGSERVRVGPPVASDPSAPTSTPPAAGALFPGIWPFTSEEDAAAYEGDEYTTAEATALAFAREYLGMPDPQIADVSRGASPHKVVTVIPRPGSPFETKLGVMALDDQYTVASAVTDNIAVDVPERAALVDGVVDVSGRSTAFEATVGVEVRADGQTFGERVGRGYVMGGANGEVGPFAGQVLIAPHSASAGAVVFFTDSAEDGSVQEASVMRVAFTSGTTRFSVFFHRGEALAEVAREIAHTPSVLRAALVSLFEGPQPSDPKGLSSLFSIGTANLLSDVNLRDDGTAIVDLAGTVPNANSSAGSRAFLEELNTTVFQFPNVERVEYRLQDSCDAFWEWLQFGECQVVPRT